MRSLSSFVLCGLEFNLDVKLLYSSKLIKGFLNGMFSNYIKIKVNRLNISRLLQKSILCLMRFPCLFFS